MISRRTRREGTDAAPRPPGVDQKERPTRWKNATAAGTACGLGFHCQEQERPISRFSAFPAEMQEQLARAYEEALESVRRPLFTYLADRGPEQFPLLRGFPFGQ